MEDGGGGLILKAIASAAVAGSLRIWARRRPDCGNGLMRAADAYSRQSQAALDGWTQGQWLAGHGPNGVRGQ